MQGQLSQNAPADDVPLPVKLQAAIMAEFPSPLAEGPQRADAVAKQTAAVMKVLVDEGHVVPGVPPLTRVLSDFKVTHDKLTLTTLALRILNMLAFTEIQTPESKPARKFIDDYLAGVNHGPAGEPMLWPGRLPGLANLLREWGFVPTIALPGQPSFVARAAPPVAVN